MYMLIWYISTLQVKNIACAGSTPASKVLG